MASAGSFTLLDDGRAVLLTARVSADGRVSVDPRSLREALGWRVEQGTLCDDASCLVVPDGVELEGPDGVDLAALASVLGRPLAVDAEERAAWLGVPAAERRRALAALAAPDFTLPDLSGRLHTLSTHRGSKVLLLAWASW